MADIEITKISESYLSIMCNNHINILLDEYFSFYADNYRFDKRYISRHWDGKIRLYSKHTHKLPLGLLDDLLEFATSRQLTYTTQFHTDKISVSNEYFHSIIDSINFSDEGELADYRYYQLNAIYTALINRKCILLSPTASGKSAIIYTIARILMKKYKILIIVPSVQLVDQLAKDFINYCSYDNYNIATHVKKIKGRCIKNC